MSRVITLTVLAVTVAMILTLVPTPVQGAEPDWVQMSDMPVALGGFAYATLPDGKVFVSMGGALLGEISEQTWMFDPYADSWEEVEPSPLGYVGASAVAMPDGKVYLFGGAYLDIGIKSQGEVLIYDTAADQWSFGTDMPDAVFYLEAVALDNERILLIGGVNQTSFDPSRKCWIYNVQSDGFEATAALSSARAVGVTVKAGNSIYYVGGSDLTIICQEEIFRYDVPTGSWELAGRMPEGRYYDNGALGDDGLLYMYGGKTGGSDSLVGAGTMRVVDMKNSSFVTSPDPPMACTDSGVITTGDGRLIIFGGNINQTANQDAVYSLQIFEKNAWLGEDTSAPGGGVRLFLQVDVSLTDDEALTAEVFLERDGLSYGSYHLSSMNGEASTYIALPEDLEAGEYELAISDLDLGVGVGCSIGFEPLTLTVTDAPSPTDRIGDMQDQLNETQAALDDLQNELDAKQDALFGYLILILVLITLVIGVVILVRKK